MRDLVITTAAREECIAEARNLFTRKYNETFFKIYGPFLSDYEIVIKEEAHRIFIFLQNFNVIRKILRIFGDLIQKIEISFEKIHVTEGKEIVKHFNDYATESLSHLVLNDCKENVLDDLKRAFQNVKNLTLSTLLSDKLMVSSNATMLNKVFPNLNWLHLGSTKTTDWQLIGGTFHELIYLDVEVPRTFKRRSRPVDSNVLNLLRSNPQIEILVLRKSTLKLLKGASVLPHLKTLEINALSDQYFNHYGDAIQFETVEFLIITSDRKNRVPENVRFNHVYKLNLNIASEINDKWIEFITNQVNRNVTELKLVMFNISTENFWNVAEILPVLKRVSIECSSVFSANDILMFIEKSTKIVKLNLEIRILEPDERQLYENLQQNGWNISCSPAYGKKVSITLER